MMRPAQDTCRLEAPDQIVMNPADRLVLVVVADFYPIIPGRQNFVDLSLFDLGKGRVFPTWAFSDIGRIYLDDGG